MLLQDVTRLKAAMDEVESELTDPNRKVSFKKLAKSALTIAQEALEGATLLLEGFPPTPSERPPLTAQPTCPTCSYWVGGALRGKCTQANNASQGPSDWCAEYIMKKPLSLEDRVRFLEVQVQDMQRVLDSKIIRSTYGS